MRPLVVDAPFVVGLPPMSRKLAIPGMSTKGKDVALGEAMVGGVDSVIIWVEA